MKSAKVVRVLLALSTLMGIASTAPALAAPSLQNVQRQIVSLQVQASSLAEGAQAAKVQLDQLTRTLTGIRQQAAVQGASVSQLRRFEIIVGVRCAATEKLPSEPHGVIRMS